MTILGVSDDYWIMGGLAAAGVAVLVVLSWLSSRLAGRGGLLVTGAGILAQIGWFAIRLSYDPAFGEDIPSLSFAASTAVYLHAGVFGTLFFMGVGSIFLVAAPMALLDEVSRWLAVVFLVSAAVFVLFQVAVHKRFGREALLLVLFLEIVAASAFWFYRALQPLPIEWSGMYEALSFSQTILICSLSALTLMVLEKRRRKTINLAPA